MQTYFCSFREWMEGKKGLVSINVGQRDYESDESTNEGERQ